MPGRVITPLYRPAESIGASSRQNRKSHVRRVRSGPSADRYHAPASAYKLQWMNVVGGRPVKAGATLQSDGRQQSQADQQLPFLPSAQSPTDLTSAAAPCIVLQAVRRNPLVNASAISSRFIIHVLRFLPKRTSRRAQGNDKTSDVCIGSMPDRADQGVRLGLGTPLRTAKADDRKCKAPAFQILPLSATFCTGRTIRHLACLVHST